ncbi:hypothetical protein [Streptomyces sp. AC602_WCS936]|uniref:hypothetical protein n=1 Tax=Streptomyces sp. AC602_WCS936 TaxID=2823685 RepID=UPI001C255D4C|nr:hypothetical protein [Streptomyces sp. AC602_WCS936]
MNRDLSSDCLNPELREKLSGRAMVTAFCMALGVPPQAALDDENAHLTEISRRDSLALEEVTHLRARAGDWNEEYAQAWADGLAEGHAIAVLRILQGRGVLVTGDIWERVSNCSDLRVLTRWLSRSYSVTRAQDLFGTGPESPRVPGR